MYILICIACKVSKIGIFSEPERMGCGSSAFPTYLSFFPKYNVQLFCFCLFYHLCWVCEKWKWNFFEECERCVWYFLYFDALSKSQLKRENRSVLSCVAKLARPNPRRRAFWPKRQTSAHVYCSLSAWMNVTKLPQNCSKCPLTAYTCIRKT